MFKHDHIALRVRDLDSSKEFYQYLGGRVVSKPSPNFLEITLGELRLHLIPMGANEQPQVVNPKFPAIDHLCLRVDSFSDLVFMQAKINSHPSSAKNGPYMIEESEPLGPDGKSHCEERPPRKTLYFEDPDGIKIEVRAY